MHSFLFSSFSVFKSLAKRTKCKGRLIRRVEHQTPHGSVTLRELLLHSCSLSSLLSGIHIYTYIFVYVHRWYITEIYVYVYAYAYMLFHVRLYVLSKKSEKLVRMKNASLSFRFLAVVRSRGAGRGGAAEAALVGKNRGVLGGSSVPSS